MPDIESRNPDGTLFNNLLNLNVSPSAVQHLILNENYSAGFSNNTTAGFFNHSGHDYQFFDEYPYLYRDWVLRTVYHIEIPIICALGLFGNGMAILLLQTDTNLKRLASNSYLVALASLSSVFLVTLVLVWSETLLEDFQVYGNHPFGCKIITFLGGASDFACIWFIVAASLDRFIILYWPLERKRIYLANQYMPKRIVALILLISCVIHSWVIVVADVVENEGCAIQDHYSETWEIFNTIETIYSIIIPSLIVIIANAFVIYKLAVYRQYMPDSLSVTFSPSVTTNHTINNNNNINNNTVNLNNNQQTPGLVINGRNAVSFNESLLHVPESIRLQSARNSLCTEFPRADVDRRGSGMLHQILSNINKRRISLQSQKLRPQDLRMTKSLLILTTTFVLLNLPHYLYRVLLPYDTNQTWVVVTLHICYFLYYLHHAFLFFFYVFNSSKMRKQLRPTAMKLLECYCIKTVPEFGHIPVNPYK